MMDKIDRSFTAELAAKRDKRESDMADILAASALLGRTWA